MPDYTKLKSEISNYWAIQDNLLQWYRAIFITAESLLFGAGTNAYFYGSQVAFVLLLISGIIMTWLWTIVCNKRGLDVSYFHMLLKQIEKKENGTEEEKKAIPEIKPNVFQEFKENWQSSKMKVTEKVELLRKHQLYSKTKWTYRVWDLSTREIMGSYLPAFFILLWFAMTIIVFSHPLPPDTVFCKQTP